MKILLKFLVAFLLISLIVNQTPETDNNKSTDSPDNQTKEKDNSEEPNKEESTDSKKYNLVVLGDQGEFVYFTEKYASVKKLEITNNEKIDKIFENTTYDTKEGKCIITDNGTKMELTDLESKENRAKGMKNFEDLISTKALQDNIKIADGIVFLGDTIYPGDKKLAIVDENKKATLYSQDKWNERLTCGWNVFIKQLESIGLYQNNQLDERVDINTGNHSYDVSFNKEEEIVKSIKKKKENSQFYEWDDQNNKAKITEDENPTSYSYVKKLFIPADKAGRNITFIDFNTSPFISLGACSNEEEYNDPKKFKFDNYYINRWKYDRVVKYFKTLYDIVSNLDKTHWNVIRGHHPPSNFEDSDAMFYWDVKIDGNVYNLMNKFEENNVRVFLGSHIHMAAVMVVPFNKSPMRKTDWGGKKAENNGSYCNENNLKADSTELLDVENKCTKNSFDLDLEKQKLMIVFINGNGGRHFDSLSDGARSQSGNMVWAKKNQVTIDGVLKDAMGFSFAEIKNDSITYKFYEETVADDKSVDAKLVATFKVLFDNSTDDSNALIIILIIGLILISLALIGLAIRHIMNKKKNTENQPLNQEMNNNL